MAKVTSGGASNAPAGQPGGQEPAAPAAGASGVPGRKASKQEWADHAVAQGADPEEVAGMTKAELIERHGQAEGGDGDAEGVS